MPEKLTLEWARKFFTDRRYSGRTAISVYAEYTDLSPESRYYLGIAVREHTLGEAPEPELRTVAEIQTAIWYKLTLPMHADDIDDGILVQEDGTWVAATSPDQTVGHWYVDGPAIDILECGSRHTEECES